MIYARRFHWQGANPLEVTALLDEFVAHPEFLPYPMGPDVARASFAAMLVDANNVAWTTYTDRDLTGCVILTRIVPRVNALLYFFFLDKDLAAKRKLLHNLLGYCFGELGLNRLSLEVPDKVLCVKVKGGGKAPVALGTRLERFARRSLGFRLEGEIRKRNPELPISISDEWVARQGSRIEQAYFDGERWYDIMRLRLLASEWVGTVETGVPAWESFQHCYQSQDQSSAASSEVEGRKTPSPSSPKTSSPSDSRT